MGHTNKTCAERRRRDGYALLSHSGSNLGHDTGNVDRAFRLMIG
jgi:hypothetical protein